MYGLLKGKVPLSDIPTQRSSKWQYEISLLKFLQGAIMKYPYLKVSKVSLWDIPT